MCLLAVFHRVHPDAPLIVAANRDEWLARPASAMAVLREKDPRVLGGRDELAGGTWLAVNEEGVFAGLTNQPMRGRRDPAKRSRGALPLALVSHKTAKEAAQAFVKDFRPQDYNPAWLFVGDRQTLYYIDFTGGEQAIVVPLKPGLHILENRSLGADSPKVERVRFLLDGAERRSGPELVDFLFGVLKNHDIPARALREAPLSRIPPKTQAPCVHAGPYGTRSSEILVVPEGTQRPRLFYTAGPPCVSPLNSADAYWFA